MSVMFLERCNGEREEKINWHCKIKQYFGVVSVRRQLLVLMVSHLPKLSCARDGGEQRGWWGGERDLSLR